MNGGHGRAAASTQPYSPTANDEPLGAVPDDIRNRPKMVPPPRIATIQCVGNLELPVFKDEFSVILRVVAASMLVGANMDAATSRSMTEPDHRTQ